jgi:ribonucleoside-diphosphate reductase alpha chain
MYIYAYDSGLKGITAYRDNCRRTGILSEIKADPEEIFDDEETPKFNYISPVSRSTFRKTYGTTIDKRTACGKLYISINRDSEGNLVESFVGTSKNGICRSNIDGINRLLSLCLRSGVKVDEVIDQLKSINCPACHNMKGKGQPIDGMSCPDVIARALEEEYNTTETLTIVRKSKTLSDNLNNVKIKKPIAKPEISLKDESENLCPDCGSDKYNPSGGCRVCLDCGYSRCSS